jgi:two-component system cell cycle sensor histidine kinase/response regulator CckA
MAGAAPKMVYSNYRVLFENAPEAMIVVSEDTLRITGANLRAVSFLALEPEGLERPSLHHFLQPQDLDRIVALLGSGALSGELQGCKIRYPNGSLIEADIAFTHLPAEKAVIVAFHDAASRAKLNEQLRQAQKMEGLGMLAGGIAHDFNNLLTIISGYSQMLLSSSHLRTERDRTAIEQVMKASERAADLTSQLLAFSRRQTIQPRVLEVNRIVDQTVAMLRRLIGEDIDLRIAKAQDAGRIHADPGQIQQVLINLAINSRDAMPEGGSLLVQTGRAQLNSDYVGQHLGVKPGSYVTLEVSDTGSGMDEATRKRVFEPFFTTKPQGKGTGLGLSTVYGIVRQCGGSIDIYTEPGHGTTFRVYLPRVLDEASEEREQEQEPVGGHETVLVVEDEDGVRKMVHTALERSGYQVLVASSGPEALGIAAAHEGPIDLLITDMIMPRMNGGELAKRFEKLRPAMALLFISGYAGNTLQTTGNLESQAAFLQKPFAPAALLSRVRELLDARKGESESARC